MLAQPSRDFARVQSLLLWCSARFARATFLSVCTSRIALVGVTCATFCQQSLSPCACQIALVVARCPFWHGTRNHLVTLRVSTHCGAALVLSVKEICTEVFPRTCFWESLRRDLDKRSLTKILPSCLVYRPCTEILRGLLRISCQETSRRLAR
jgi:hypothetical protein